SISTRVSARRRRPGLATSSGASRSTPASPCRRGVDSACGRWNGWPPRMASNPAGVTLSEHASKALVARYGVALPREALATDAAGAGGAAEPFGLPVALQLCGDAIAHKTERDLVRLGLPDAKAVRAAAGDLLGLARPEDGPVQLLVAEQVRGRRELIAGLMRDPQFGPCVLAGRGGIFTEALGDVVFAAAPLSLVEAQRMIDGLRTQPLLGPFRGEPAVDRGALARLLVGLGRLGVERADVRSVDLNPLIVRDGVPVAVDALVELDASPPPAAPARRTPDPAVLLEQFRPLFHPRGVVVAGVSSHPGKFGAVAFHNLLRFGYRGQVFPLNRDGAEVLGHATLRDVAEVPEGAADLAVVCTPAAVNAALLRACAARGVRAAFVASGGYGESGPEGKALAAELVRAADECGILAAGPERPGRGAARRGSGRADRGAIPASRTHLGGEPERQPVLGAPQLLRPHRDRREQGDLLRQLGADDDRRLPRVLRGRSGDGRRARVYRGRRRRPRLPRRTPPAGGRQAPRAAQGRRRRRGPARRSQPHP